MTTDTTEKGLEALITAALLERGWQTGDPPAYDRDYAVDLAQLAAFLDATQPGAGEALDLGAASPTRQKFLARLQGEITKRGVIDVSATASSTGRIAWTSSMARRRRAMPAPPSGMR